MKSLSRELFFIIGLIVVILVVYYPILKHDFLYTWDDRWQVLSVYTYNGLTWKNINNIFSNFYMGQYSPLNQLFYTITYDLFGVNPLAFHSINLCWHISCVLLTYVFIKKILLLMNYNKENQSVRWIAFCVALLMGIHPVQVEPVSWLSASKILVQAFFFMLGLVCYLFYLQKEKVRYYLLCICSFILAFLCKEQAAIFPFCLLLLDYIAKRNFRNLNLWIEKVPFFMLSLCFGLITLISFSQMAREMVNGTNTYSLFYRFVFMSYSVTEYVTKLILPVKLMYVYPFPIAHNEALPFMFYIYPLILIGLFILFWKGRKQYVLVFGSLFFVIQLLLMLHIIPMPRFYICADRYLYLACIGFFFIVVWYLFELRRSLNKTKWNVFISIFCGIILFMGLYSNRISRKWANDVSLKQEMGELLKTALEKNIHNSNSLF